MEHEGKYLEYKETVSRTYLKTVSAFANYGPGTIIFGITDDFQTVGVADPLRTALDIENQINYRSNSASALEMKNEQF